MGATSNIWKLYDAKNRLGELVERAGTTPQTITVHGREAVVVLAIAEYRRLAKPKVKLSDVVYDPDLADIELDLERDTTVGERGTPVELPD